MHRVLICAAATLFVIACQSKTETTTLPAKKQVTTKTTTVAGPPVNLGKAKINQVIPVAEAGSLAQAQLGSATAQNNHVTEEKNTFKRGDRIFLTLTVREVPAGLRLGARWYDAKEKLIGEETKTPAADKSATFQWNGKPLKAGKYKVEGYWGGNLAAEKTFEVK